jgi:hypothetical protein
MLFTSGCLGNNESEESTQMESITGSIQGNATQVWFSVNSTDTQALMVESLYTSYCSPIDDEMDNQTGEFPYGCGFSGASLKVNSTCNGAIMTNTASSGIWLPTGNCIHEFGELGPFDEGHQHLAPYRNVTWNLMYTIHPVDAVN